MDVSIETFHEEINTAPLLKGLPDDCFQCPHLGYMLEGQFHVHYADREETIDTGEVYYLESGHQVTQTARTKLIEFSPSEGHNETREVIMKNYEKMQEQM